MAASSDASVHETPSGFECSSKLAIEHSYTFVQNIFDPKHPQLAQPYKDLKRVLAIVDHNIYDMYHPKITAYFREHGIEPALYRAVVSEDRKDVDTMLEFCDAMTKFGILRREPLLVIGGGLITDVVGFSCAVYRRSTRYIRVPTTLVGLIDASVSNRVAVNWKGLKNRLGGYHEPVATYLDWTFLRTIPDGEIRNGLAELIKIFSTTDIKSYEAIEKHGNALIHTRFGMKDCWDSLVCSDAPRILHEGILRVLEREIPNSREHNLNRVMYYGHTWSPTLELATSPELVHGHAVAVDMAFSATLSMVLGHLPADSHARYMGLFSDLGLSLDRPEFTLNLLFGATEATVATRNGHLRAPLPTGNLGEHIIVPDVAWIDLERAWGTHKRYVSKLPRKGLGVEATIDIRDKIFREEIENVEKEGVQGAGRGVGRVNSRDSGSSSGSGSSRNEQVTKNVRGFGPYAGERGAACVDGHGALLTVG